MSNRPNITRNYQQKTWSRLSRRTPHINVTSCARVLTLLLISAITPSISSADPVYKYTDEFDNVHYSTKPLEGAESEALPTIERENIDDRIRKLKDQTPPNCGDHGGVDCEKGADEDGSVVCHDGFDGATLRYSVSCSQVKLQLQPAIYLGQGGKPLEKLPLNSTRPIEVIGMQVALRNLSRGEAKAIRLYLMFPDRRRIEAAGPLTIEGFGVAEYSIALTEPLHRTPYYLSQAEVRASCDNCSAVVKNR